MSSQKGNINRSRPQKFKNAFSYKNNMHVNSNLLKHLNTKKFTSLCSKCQDIIEWKVKYNKYKPLTVAAKCIKCEQKAVKEAYHAVCSNCCKDLGICAKCLEKFERNEDSNQTKSENTLINDEGVLNAKEEDSCTKPDANSREA